MEYLKKSRRKLTYNQQCLVAIARALPEGDDYRDIIKSKVYAEPDWTLQELISENPCSGLTGLSRAESPEIAQDHSTWRGLGRCEIDVARRVSRTS